VRVEHTLDTAKVPSAGFEDREDHRIPFASVLNESKRNLVLFQMSSTRPPLSSRQRRRIRTHSVQSFLVFSLHAANLLMR